MASRPIIMAPGVHFQETDISQYIRELSTTKLALVGVASKGPLNVATLCTSLQQVIDTFGVPKAAYPMLLAAREFYNAGGGECWIVRVANGDLLAASTIPLINSSNATVNPPTTGGFFNDCTQKISYGTQKSSTRVTSSFTFTSGSGTHNFSAFSNVPLVPGTVSVKFGATVALKDDGAGALVGQVGYTAYGGTVNYQTGVVTVTWTGLGADNAATVNIDSSYWSTFTLQNIFTAYDSAGDIVNEYVLESFPGLTLATMVSKLASSKLVNVTAPFAAFPVAGSYRMSGGNDGKDSILDADYVGANIGGVVTGLQQFAFPDQIDINLIAVPGVSSLAVRQAITQLCEVSRNDTLGLLDVPANVNNVQDAADWADGHGSFSSYDTLDSTYTAAYFPAYTSFNNVTNDNDVTPATCAAIAACARSDYWEAPAGPNRGKLSNIIDINVKLNQVDRAYLYEHRINPIGDLNGIGVMLLGQQTTTTTPSSLDRVAARRTLMQIEKAVTTALYPLLFEPNTPKTWNRATMIVQPYLDSLVAQERLYSALFICNRDTNTDTVINNNQMNATCRLQLLKYAEIIVVNFLITALGGEVTENILNVKSA